MFITVIIVPNYYLQRVTFHIRIFWPPAPRNYSPANRHFAYCFIAAMACTKRKV